MLSQLKDITLRIVACANAVTVALMLLCGFSDRLNPVGHPLLANAGLAFPLFLFANFCFLVFFLVFRKKYALVSIAGFVAGYQPVRTYCPFNIVRDTPPGAVKVLSYNVHGFVAGNPPEDSPNPILDYVMASDADIVCLQEARLSGAILETVGGAYAYVDSVVHPTYADCLVLLSRYPILSKERIDYESKGNLSAAFKVDIGGEVVTVVNNHFETTGLSLSDRAGFKDMVKGKSGKDTIKAESKRIAVKLGEAAGRRAPQVDAVAAYVRGCRGPVVLCGDFNDSPISYARRTLGNVLTDCYIATGNGPGISYHHNAFFVRIDNIMCSDHWKPYGCKVDRSNGYSDHYPIYCWLKRDENSKNDR